MTLPSESYVARGILTYLQDELSLSSGSECNIMPNGKPPAVCGDFFISIHSFTATENAIAEETLSEMISGTITVTYRDVHIPQDFYSANNTTDSPKIYARRIRNLIHRNYTLLAAINALVPVDTSLTAPKIALGYSKYITPLQFTGTMTEYDAPPDWFSSEASNPIISGRVFDLNFSNCQRVQRTSDLFTG